jgi:hypothetical protein
MLFLNVLRKTLLARFPSVCCGCWTRQTTGKLTLQLPTLQLPKVGMRVVVGSCGLPDFHQVSCFAETVCSFILNCLFSSAVFFSEDAEVESYLLIVCIRLAPIIVNQPCGLPNKQNFNSQ